MYLFDASPSTLRSPKRPMADTTLASTAVAVLDELFPAKTHGFDVVRRYHRIWAEGYYHRRILFFIEPETGSILKAATWKKPLDGVRYSVASSDELGDLLRSRVDAFGYWLPI